MPVEQLSIFLENKPGRIYEVTGVMKDANINIRAMSVADTNDFGIMRIIVDNIDTAFTVLKKNNYSLKKTSMVAVEIDDRPGSLHNLLKILYLEGINVEYTYSFISSVKTRGENAALIILRVEDIVKAETVLSKAGYHILKSGEELKQI